MYDLTNLESAYLASPDPYHQSGFKGGPDRWRTERGIILNAIDRPGHLLDIGCANGLLLESLMIWAAERGITLTPHGLDVGPRLIELARRRLPRSAANFHAADIWTWSPPRHYDYIYTIYDITPRERLHEYIAHLRTLFPASRHIIGAYATSSAPAPSPADLLGILPSHPAGSASAGNPARTTVVWFDT